MLLVPPRMALNSLLLLQGHLVFLPVSYSLMAEAAASVASASADAFSSASSAWSIVAPAASAASLALRPKVLL